VEIPGRKSLRRNISSGQMGQLDTPDHQEALHELYTYMDSSDGTSGVTTRDDGLSFYSNILGGRLHFLHFETRNMVSGIEMLSSTGITENIRTIGCTGGGAHKYAKEFQDQLGITFTQFDELGCLVRGMNFALTNVVGECYTYRNRSPAPPKPQNTNPTDNVKTASQEGLRKSSREAAEANMVSEDSLNSKEQEEINKTANNSTSYVTHKDEASDETEDRKGRVDSNKAKEQKVKDEGWHRDVKESTYKVFMPHEMFVTGELFPYLVVNIGSGVSILKVQSPGVFERVSGSSLGGGTYWGLCRLLTKCASYDEVLDIAETGDAGEVDMLVKDIYGGSYDGMNLSGSMVASSFGKLVMKEHPREGVKEEDLAIALLMMITNNIGQVSYLNAQLHGCTKIFFVGTFLRHNPISCRRLAYAINFWSKGKMEALFLVHEGYFGALGTFLQSAFGDEVDKILNLSKSNGGKEQEGTALPFVSRKQNNTISKSSSIDSTLDSSKHDKENKANELKRKDKDKVPSMPSFQQFRKATELLWERAQDLLPRPKVNGENVSTSTASTTDLGFGDDGYKGNRHASADDIQSMSRPTTVEVKATSRSGSPTGSSTEVNSNIKVKKDDNQTGNSISSNTNVDNSLIEKEAVDSDRTAFGVEKKVVSRCRGFSNPIKRSSSSTLDSDPEGDLVPSPLSNPSSSAQCGSNSPSTKSNSTTSSTKSIISTNSRPIISSDDCIVNNKFLNHISSSISDPGCEEDLRRKVLRY
jgi:pantothenate kinase